MERDFNNYYFIIRGGDAVDFVRRFYNKDYGEAVEMLLNNCGGQIITSPPIEKEHKPFELPPRNDRISRVFSYLLLTRGVDKDVLYEFVRRKMIYESADYHNAVFVGYDSSGKPRHAHKKGTVTSNAYKGNVAGSQPEFSFHWHGTSDKIFLFEAPIDMLSYISMHKENWKNHSYAASCSVSDRVLFQCLKDNTNIILCFDNDEAGQTANKRIAEKLSEQNIESKILIPTHKDWNDELIFEPKGVESEYIVGVGLFPNPTDTTTLIPFLERILKNTGKKYENIIADAGYASEENYTYLESEEQNAYIKPADYEISKKRKYKNDIYRKENLFYDETGDYFVCPNGKKLIFAYDSKRKSQNGYETTKRNYICEDCSGCPHREKCYKGKYENRKIAFSPTMARQKKEATERITTNEGIILRMNRAIQVEGAFGVIKQDFAFRRFLTREKAKTETQFFLLAFAFNIQKLWNRTNSDRFHKPLFEKKLA